MFYKVHDNKLVLVNKSKYPNMTPDNFIISTSKKIWIIKDCAIEVHGLDCELDYAINTRKGRLMRTHDLDHGTLSHDKKSLYFSKLGNTFAKKHVLNQITEQVLKVPRIIEKYEILPGGETFYFMRLVPGQKSNHFLYVTFLEGDKQPLPGKLFSTSGKLLDFRVYSDFKGVRHKYLVLILSQHKQHLSISQVIFSHDKFKRLNISPNFEVFSVKRKQKFTKSSITNRNVVKEFVYNRHNEMIYVFNLREKQSTMHRKLGLEIFRKSMKLQSNIEIGNFYSEVSSENWQCQNFPLNDDFTFSRLTVEGFPLEHSKSTGFLYRADSHSLLSRIGDDHRGKFQLTRVYEYNERQFIHVNPGKNRFYVLKNNILKVLHLESGRLMMELKLKYQSFIPRFHRQQDSLVIFEYNKKKRDIITRHEFDLDSLLEVKHTPVWTRREEIAAECASLSPENPLTQIDLESYYEPFYGCEIPKSLNWDVANVPIGFIPDLFRKETYRKTLRFFADFYFPFILTHGGVDYMFRELNPLFICVYHNDAPLLYKLLKKHFYPEFPPTSRFSPLKYAFDMKYFACISAICEYSLRQDVKFPRFTHDDFHCLLTSNKPICHMVLPRFFIQMSPKVVPNFIQMKGNFRFDYKGSVIEYIMDNIPPPSIQSRHPLLSLSRAPSQADYRGIGSCEYIKKQHQVFTFEEASDPDLMVSYERGLVADPGDYPYRESEPPVQEKKIDYYKHKNKHDPKEVDTFRLGIRLDMTTGSKEMIYFLFHYSNSKCNEFINSKWRFLVLDRWTKFWPWHFVCSLFYWIFTFCVALMIIFDTKVSGLYTANFILTIILFFVNFVRFLGFIRLKR